MAIQVGGLVVSRETTEKLEAFATLVAKWTPKINLIASSTVANTWNRHINDSAQIYRFAPYSFDKWVDIGSGGGFPGIVMAIMAQEKQPQARITLIESDQRKATFLRTAGRELNLAITVIAGRVEQQPRQQADILSARALTSLSRLLPLAVQHLRPDGMAFLHKGQTAHQEIAQAQKDWSFALEEHASITDPNARILAIQRIVRIG